MIGSPTLELEPSAYAQFRMPVESKREPLAALFLARFFRPAGNIDFPAARPIPCSDDIDDDCPMLGKPPELKTA